MQRPAPRLAQGPDFNATLWLIRGSAAVTRRLFIQVDPQVIAHVAEADGRELLKDAVRRNPDPLVPLGDLPANCSGNHNISQQR